MNRFIAFAIFVLALAIAPSALAFTPPTMTAHVTDTAHKLTEAERIAIDKKLEDYRLRSTNEVAVLIPASLDGATIEEATIETARAWKLGVKGKDNGVLLVIAPAERKARIEVGKGIEGALTDLQSNDVIRNKIRPRLTPGSENYRAAVDDATDAIIADLDAGGATGGSAPRHAKKATGGDLVFGIIFLLIMIGIPIIFMIVIIKAIARAFSSNGRSAGAGWASGSSWSNDSSWSSGGGGGSDWSSGGGGGGDSGFSGGGGDFGGGGSSDSF
jgi:uncharacterized protein